jgi:hypothetical protein
MRRLRDMSGVVDEALVERLAKILRYTEGLLCDDTAAQLVIAELSRDYAIVPKAEYIKLAADYIRLAAAKEASPDV